MLSNEEVSKLFSCVRTAKTRTILETMYGAGLREYQQTRGMLAMLGQ